MSGNLSRSFKNARLQPCLAKSHAEQQHRHFTQQPRKGAPRRCHASERSPHHDTLRQMANHDSGRTENRRNQRPTSKAWNRLVRKTPDAPWQCLHHTRRKALDHELPKDAAQTRHEHTHPAIPSNTRTAHDRHQASAEPTAIFSPSRCHWLGQVPQQTPSRGTGSTTKQLQLRATQETQQTSNKQAISNPHEEPQPVAKPKRFRTTGQNHARHETQEAQVAVQSPLQQRPPHVHCHTATPTSQESHALVPESKTIRTSATATSLPTVLPITLATLLEHLDAWALQNLLQTSKCGHDSPQHQSLRRDARALRQALTILTHDIRLPGLPIVYDVTITPQHLLDQQPMHRSLHASITNPETSAPANPTDHNRHMQELLRQGEASTFTELVKKMNHNWQQDKRFQAFLHFLNDSRTTVSYTPQFSQSEYHFRDIISPARLQVDFRYRNHSGSLHAE